MAPGASGGEASRCPRPRRPSPPAASANQSTARHELFFFNYFRLGQAAVYTALAFRPEHMNWPALPDPVLARLFAMAYLLAALVMVARTRHTLQPAGPDRLHRPHPGHRRGADGPGPHARRAHGRGHDAGREHRHGRPAAALPPVHVLRRAGHARPCSGTRCSTSAFGRTVPTARWWSTASFGAAYFACASLCYVLGRNIRASEALAEQRGIDLANLSQVNELIIRRMKTGVLLVDEGNRIHQLNESAWMLMGNPSADQRDLGSLAPELSRRLYHWRTSGKLDESATMLADGTPEVVPRFSRLAPNDDSHVLIFLDDTSLVSRRAEELTLSSLGRLVRLDRARDPQSARRDPLFGPVAGRIHRHERYRPAHGRDHQQPLLAPQRDHREHPATRRAASVRARRPSTSASGCTTS